MSNKKSNASIEDILKRLDGSGSDDEWRSIFELRALLGDELPGYLLELYKRSSVMQVRSACVYHSIRYARTSDLAVDLAFLAVRDRAKIVRYRGCMLLACSQRIALLPRLQSLLDEVRENTKLDLLAAIDAIRERNQSYFIDREHSGMIVINIA